MANQSIGLFGTVGGLGSLRDCGNANAQPIPFSADVRPSV